MKGRGKGQGDSFSHREKGGEKETKSRNGRKEDTKPEQGESEQ